MTGKEIETIDGEQAPVKFEPPALETFERYSSDLVPLSYDDIDESGKTVAKTWPLPEIKPHTKLIPEPDCRAIIDELVAALVPANYDSAKTLTEKIVGRGIGTKFNNVAVFVSETTNLFSKYPAYIGFRAVELLESFEYGVPHVGDISAVLEPLVEKLRRALHQARAHLAEHERRAGKSAPAGELSKKSRASRDWHRPSRPQSARTNSKFFGRPCGWFPTTVAAWFSRSRRDFYET